MDRAWTALVLAGGRGRRLGMGEKSQVDLGGRAMLDVVIGGLPSDTSVVVVGPQVATERPVQFVLDEPRFGGPVAGLSAGIPLVTTPLVAVLATDMPRAAGLIALLLGEMTDGDDALIPVDGSGRLQPLCAIYRTLVLAQALRELGDPQGKAVRELIGRLRVTEHHLSHVEGQLVEDIDTPADLAKHGLP